MAADFESGLILAGRYLIDRTLGRGGMGTVYRAIDRVTGQPLALKVLGRTEDPAVTALQEALFEREYHILAQLDHPHVVRAYDYGVYTAERERECSFYTMELLERGDLRAELPLPWKRACAIARDVCAALALLHSRRLLHRDVGSRNVRLDEHGRAKLIDFGAMVPMGPTNSFVGTPPAVPPEVLRGQALDGRVDLYAVGALLYQLLAARHAYPARRFGELAERWRVPLARPSAYAPDVPPALDALVLELLALDHNARPRTAAEVIERLTAIARLPPDDSEALSRAYLLTPSLVGRERELAVVKDAVKRLADGARGGCLEVEGGLGMGRSRMIDGAVLAAQIAGVTALRVSASELLPEPFSVVRALCATALEVARPELLAAASPDAAILCHAVPALYAELERPALAQLAPLDRLPRIQEALARLFRRLSAARPLVLAVDDLERADEASAAWLSALATEPDGARLLLVFTRDGSVPAGSACQLLSELATTVRLRPLDPAQTEALLGSVFGDVPGLSATARWVQRVAFGNPQKSMALAQHLVDHDHARFSHGSWELPADLSALSLPDSMQGALDVQVKALSHGALRVACLLTLSLDGTPLSLGELSRLGVADTTLDPLALHAAMEELTEKQIAYLSDGRLFIHSGFESAVRRRLDAATARRLHALLARACSERGDNDMVVVHHLQQAGKDEAALERMRASLEPTRDPYVLDLLNARRAALIASVLRRVLSHAQTCGEPQSLLHALWLRINTLASVFDIEPAFDEPLALLHHDIGLDFYEQDKGEPDPERRMRHALERARQRYADTVREQRGVDPATALVLYRQSVGRFLGRGSASLDLGMLRRARALLEPVLPLSPAFQLLHASVHIAERGLSGLDVLPELEDVLDRMIATNDGQERRYADLLRMGLRYRLALEQARRGDPSLEHARFFDLNPATRDLAAAIAMFVNLNQGRIDEADRERERLRALSARGFSSRILTDLLYNEVVAYALIGSITHLKRVLEPVDAMAKRHRGWAPMKWVAHASYHLHRGEPELALEQAERVLSHVGPGEHLAWLVAMPIAIRALNELGRASVAASRARDAVVGTRELPLHPLGRVLLLAGQAEAEALAGYGDAAAQTELSAEREIELSGLDGVPRLYGLVLCARAAIASDERIAYERCMAAIDQICARARGSALYALADRVRVAAQARGWQHGGQVTAAPRATVSPETDDIATIPGGSGSIKP